MFRTRTVAIGSLAVTAAAAFALGGLLQPSARADADVVTITLKQEAPTRTAIDLGEPGPSAGDLQFFEAKLSGDGGLTATLTGLVITAHVPPAGSEGEETALAQMTFDFGDGNSLVVEGKHVYPGAGAEFTPGAPQVRAVVGGTGIYMGARGQLETSRQDDDSYAHAFTLIEE